MDLLFPTEREIRGQLRRGEDEEVALLQGEPEGQLTRPGGQLLLRDGGDVDVDLLPVAVADGGEQDDAVRVLLGERVLLIAVGAACGDLEIVADLLLAGGVDAADGVGGGALDFYF